MLRGLHVCWPWRPPQLRVTRAVVAQTRGQLEQLKALPGLQDTAGPTWPARPQALVKSQARGPLPTGVS